MGAVFGAECYPDAAAAAAAQCVGLSGVSAGGFLQCSGIAGSSAAPTLTMTLTPAEGAASSFSVPFTVVACDPYEGFADISALYALAIPAVLAVVLVRQFIYRLVMPQ